jgi:hypothetical protein
MVCFCGQIYGLTTLRKPETLFSIAEIEQNKQLS